MNFCILVIMFLSLNIGEMATAQNSNTKVDVKVGVILDMDTWLGKICLSSIEMALDDFYASYPHYKTRLLLSTRNVPCSDIVGAASAAVDLLKNVKVQAIIGPSTSMQANFLADLGSKANVPIISFSATSSSVSSIRTPYFVRCTQNDTTQLKSISAIVKAFGWTSIIPVSIGDDLGQGIIPFLIDALQKIDVRVPFQSIISPAATDDQVVAELEKLRKMQTSVFVVHMGPNLGSRFFTKAKELKMMEKGYVWIITEELANKLSLLTPSIIDSMEGVLGIKPYVPDSKQGLKFTLRWKRKFQQDNPNVRHAKMNVFGLWAYDAAVSLAMSVENVGSTNFGYTKANVSRNSTDLESFGVSTSGFKLLQSLNTIKFRGLSGDFRLVGGQLQVSAYEIINVLGKGARTIGYWNETSEITKSLGFNNISPNYKDNLGTIIWPGDRTPPARSCQISNGKRLKIGVPVKGGFAELLNVKRNPDGCNIVTGYSINVFEKVIKELPFELFYDYYPFAYDNGTTRGTYNDLVYQVKTGEYDAVVGDITITAHRSNYVDFTLPYTESGISLIIPNEANGKKNPWEFLKPLTWDLWVASFCSFVFLGFVIWLLEHRTNEDFRGPPSHQAGVILYFSFSTLVFAQKERVLSNLGRLVLVVWMFVVFILTQSYTASLASRLTVEQHQPLYMKELARNRKNVGYLEGSFTLDILKEMGFRDDNLKVYSSVEECHMLFLNGSIVAAFDEIPYARIFLAKYCSKFAIVKPTHNTVGFGFVFPKGSPLVQDVSNAVLKVIEANKIDDISDSLGQHVDCEDTSLSLNSLTIESFWGLFLIAISTSVLAVVTYIAMFLYEHRNILSNHEPQKSLWEYILILAKLLDNKGSKSHTIRETGVQDRNGADMANEAALVDPSVGGNYSPNNDQESPSTISINTDGYLAFHGEQCSPTNDCSDQETQAQIGSEIMQELELVIETQDRSRIS